jgi:hypothetical protein
MPRYALYVMVALFVLGLALVRWAGIMVGWQFCLGFTTGTVVFYLMFRWHYGWWPDFNWDGEDRPNSQLPRIKVD